MRASYKMAAILVVLVSLFVIPVATAQTPPTPLQCGQILTAEAVQRYGEQEYSISLAPGDSFSVSSETVGDYMRLSLFVEAPTTGVVAASYIRNHQYAASWSPQYNTDTASFETSILSERGNYTLTVRANSPGLYTLFVGCILADGTVIGPGDLVPPTETATVSSQPAHGSSFSGFGFPGLPPVDFAGVVKLPLIPDTPMTGVISPNNNEILGFTVEVTEGAMLELSYTRVSGNLNLGIAVMSPDSKIVFQASLVASETLSTQLKLPTSGEYTIGVFRVELSPPTAPEPTVFQIRGIIR